MKRLTPKYSRRLRVKSTAFTAMWCILMVLVSSAFTASLANAQLILNGDFELWDSTTGDPPTGVPTYWTYESSTTLPIQAPGIVAGSTYSSFMQPKSGTLSQALTSTGVTNFELNFTFAAESSPYRSLHMQIKQGTSESSTSFINLRTVTGTTAGKLSLEAYTTDNGWVTLGVDLFDASVYDSATNTFTTLNAYSFTVSADLAAETPTYSIVYELIGSDNPITISGLTDFYFDPTGEDLYSVYFSTLASSKGYAVDNLSVIAIPEESSMMAVLAVTALLSALVSRKRRQR